MFRNLYLKAVSLLDQPPDVLSTGPAAPSHSDMSHVTRIFRQMTMIEYQSTKKVTEQFENLWRSMF